MSALETVIYSNLGSALVILDCHNNIEWSRTVSIGSAKHWSVHAAELTAIYVAVETS
jgi:hypothetical protein